jgi:predicted nucleic acid-binding protein
MIDKVFVDSNILIYARVSLALSYLMEDRRGF